jgi:hypothetical protein
LPLAVTITPAEPASGNQSTIRWLSGTTSGSTPSQSGREFAKIIVDRISETLRANGFVKRGRRALMSEQGDVLWFVEFQRSKKCTKNNLVLTINLGVYSLHLAKRLGMAEVRPEVANCHWRKRLGAVASDPQDKWWEVSDIFQGTNTGEEICRLLEGYALPAFRGLSSTAALKSLWEKGQCPGLTEYQRKEYLGAL